MNNDFIDARFDPEYKRIFQDKITEFDLTTQRKSYSLKVKFIGEFEERGKSALQSLLNQVFKYSERYELRLEQVNLKVHFFSPLAWEKSQGSKIGQAPHLPAARIAWYQSTPTIEVIIPDSIKSNEIVIKAVRLLCSKLFGELFFREHVPQKESFKNLPGEISTNNFETREKAHFCRFIDQFTVKQLQSIKEYGKSLGITEPKQEQKSRAELFKELINTNSPREKAVGIMEQIFKEIWEGAVYNKNKFFTQLTDKVFKVSPQTTLILPHEIKNFNYLKSHNQWIIFHALEERVQSIVNIYKDLRECLNYLEKIEPQKGIDFELNKLWCKTLNERIISLKKKQLVKEFLIDNAKLSVHQQQKQKSFPLWIWQKGLVDNFPEGTPTDKIIQRTTEQYRNSIYHKLFETAYRLIGCFKQIATTPMLYQDTTDYQRLKTLFAWLNFRYSGIVDLLYATQIAATFSSLAEPNKIRKKEAFDIYEKGWSYFISFALIHQSYLNNQLRKKRGAQFFSLIEKYITARVETQPSFRVSKLLLNYYQEDRYKLQDLINLIKEDSRIVDFFVLQQAELFDKQDRSTIEIIRSYSQSLQKWKAERYKSQINSDLATPL